MMTIFVAVLMTCTNMNLEQNIVCSVGASKEVWESKASCEKEALKLYGKAVRCIDVDVVLTGTGKDKKVELK